MSTSLVQTKTQPWAERLDAALTSRFGPAIKAQTKWNVCLHDYGGFQTTFHAEDDGLRAEINAFIGQWMDAHVPSPF